MRLVGEAAGRGRCQVRLEWRQAQTVAETAAQRKQGLWRDASQPLDPARLPGAVTSAGYDSLRHLSVARIREKSVLEIKGIFQEEWHRPPSSRHGM